jgi:uncharacterized protein YceK
MRACVLLLALGLTGCATFEAADHVAQGSPRFFAGTRLDVAAARNDDVTLDHFRKYSMDPPAYPKADLLPSFAADVVLFPIALGYTITEPLLYLE